MLKKYGDLIAGIVTAVFAVGLYIASLFIKQFSYSGLGADFVPKLVACVLLLLGVLLIVRGARDLRLHVQAEKALAADQTPEIPAFRPNYASVAASVALLLLYALLIGEVGFPIVTLAYLFLQMLVLTPRDKIKWGKFAVISAVSTAAIYGVFTYAFKIMLPMGFLG